MNEDLMEKGATAVSMFCRLNLNVKKNLPVRSGEMGLLIYISKSDVTVTPVMAADYFKVSKPMITAMVSSLCRQGYIKKIPSQTDKRSFILSPTEKAITLTDTVYEEYYLAMRILLSEMGEENYLQLVALLSRANEILKERE